MVTLERSSRGWTFFSNHGHVLIYLSRHPDARVRDIAADIGIAERSAQGILGDLTQAGYTTVNKVGRRNSYRIDPDRYFRHPMESDHTVGEILGVFLTDHKG